MISIGTRWKAGDAPPASVPRSLAEAISAAERTTDSQQLDGQFWTLTWQEQLPTCRLDDGTGFTQRRDGTVVSLDAFVISEDDDWLQE